MKTDTLALLTYKQAGDLLQVSDRTVWTLVDRGDLPAVRFGRSVRIDQRDLNAFIEKAKHEGQDAQTASRGGAT